MTKNAQWEMRKQAALVQFMELIKQAAGSPSFLNGTYDYGIPRATSIADINSQMPVPRTVPQATSPAPTATPSFAPSGLSSQNWNPAAKGMFNASGGRQNGYPLSKPQVKPVLDPQKTQQPIQSTNSNLSPKQLQQLRAADLANREAIGQNRQMAMRDQMTGVKNQQNQARQNLSSMIGSLMGGGQNAISNLFSGMQNARNALLGYLGQAIGQGSNAGPSARSPFKTNYRVT